MKHSPTTNRLILVLCAVMFAVAALAAQMAILSELPTIATSLQEGAHRISERARHAVAQLASPVQSIGPDTRQEQVPVQAPFIPVASSPEREVRAAWKRAQQADSYHFTADIKQTVVPKSTIFNVGRTNDRM
jgi:hypothetical protein